jgi:hypothetical protein
LRKLDATIPAALDDAVRRALARDPGERPSAKELGDLLGAFRQSRTPVALDLAAGPH